MQRLFGTWLSPRQVASPHICQGPSFVQRPTALRAAMTLPTSREIELETLLRQRDTQLADLTVRLFRFRPLTPSVERVSSLVCPRRMKSRSYASISRRSRHRLSRTLSRCPLPSSPYYSRISMTARPSPLPRRPLAPSPQHLRSGSRCCKTRTTSCTKS